MINTERIALLIEYLRVLQQGEIHRNEDNIHRTKNVIEEGLNIQ